MATTSGASSTRTDARAAGIVPRELRIENRFRADEHDTDARARGRQHRALDGRAGSPIPAHRVNGDDSGHGWTWTSWK